LKSLEFRLNWIGLLVVVFIVGLGFIFFDFLSFKVLAVIVNVVVVDVVVVDDVSGFNVVVVNSRESLLRSMRALLSI